MTAVLTKDRRHTSDDLLHECRMVIRSCADDARDHGELARANNLFRLMRKIDAHLLYAARARHGRENLLMEP